MQCDSGICRYAYPVTVIFCHRNPYLRVSTGLVSQWELGKSPRGASPKLLALGAKNGLAMVA